MLWDIKLLASLSDKVEFNKSWERIQHEWKENCKRFLDEYFLPQWIDTKWLITWTTWGRQGLPPDVIESVKTNLLTERQFLYLKYTFLSKKVNRRLVALLKSPYLVL
jgi:hypothetical protein